MNKKLPKNDIQKRRKNRERFLASSKLEGIEFDDRTLAMFDLFDEREWNTEMCIKYIEKLYGYDLLHK